MEQLIRKTFISDVKTLKDERALVVTISTPDVDRYGDIMVPEGADLKNYLNNPVVLFGHNATDRPAIATAEQLSVSSDGITAKVKFPAEGKSQFADEVYALYEEGIMRAWSVGFIPDMATAGKLDTGGYKINNWELLEFSAVNIPANQNALTVMKDFELSDETRKLLEEAVVKDVPANELEEKADAVVAESLAFDPASSTLTLTLSKGDKQSFVLKAGLVEALEAKTQEQDQPNESEGLIKAIEAMRDMVKQAEPTLLDVLNTMKSVAREQSESGVNT